MAIKRILKLTNTEAIVKVDGAIGPITIDLDVDLVGGNETVLNPVVNIVSILGHGAAAGAVSIVRDGETLYSFTTGTVSRIDLQDLGGLSDTTNNTFDIVVTTSGAECQCIIKLRKVSGYKTTVEVNG